MRSRPDIHALCGHAVRVVRPVPNDPVGVGESCDLFVTAEHREPNGPHSPGLRSPQAAIAAIVSTAASPRHCRPTLRSRLRVVAALVVVMVVAVCVVPRGIAPSRRRQGNVKGRVRRQQSLRNRTLLKGLSRMEFEAPSDTEVTAGLLGWHLGDGIVALRWVDDRRLRCDACAGVSDPSSMQSSWS